MWIRIFFSSSSDNPLPKPYALSIRTKSSLLYNDFLCLYQFSFSILGFFYLTPYHGCSEFPDSPCIPLKGQISHKTQIYSCCRKKLNLFPSNHWCKKLLYTVYIVCDMILYALKWNLISCMVRIFKTCCYFVSLYHNYIPGFVLNIEYIETYWCLIWIFFIFGIWRKIT